MKINLDLAIESEKFENIISYEDIEFYIKSVLESEYNAEQEVYISILLSDNKEIQKINKEYRGKDSPTDVISFAYHDTNENFNGIYDSLGDIIISLEKIEEQRLEFNHSFKREFYYVLTHGLLHLLGYDHIEEEDKKEMRKKEEEILDKYNYRRDS